jgi:hypothetical protein
MIVNRLRGARDVRLVVRRSQKLLPARHHAIFNTQDAALDWRTVDSLDV